MLAFSGRISVVILCQMLLICIRTVILSSWYFGDYLWQEVVVDDALLARHFKLYMSIVTNIRWIKSGHRLSIEIIRLRHIQCLKVMKLLLGGLTYILFTFHLSRRWQLKVSLQCLLHKLNLFRARYIILSTRLFIFVAKLFIFWCVLNAQCIAEAVCALNVLSDDLPDGWHYGKCCLQRWLGYQSLLRCYS